VPQAAPMWSQSQQAWITPGERLQIVVPNCKQGKLLSVDFNVVKGLDIDFDIMLEGADGTVARLYGPTRRAVGLQTVLEIPFDGEAYVTWDNISAWFTSRLVDFTLCFADPNESEVQSASRMRFGRARVHTAKSAQDEDAVDFVDNSSMTELRVAPGTQEEIKLDVLKGQRLNVSFEVIENRDIDFGIVLVPSDPDAGGAINLYGPSRRACKLTTSIPVPESGTVHVGFDTSYTWISSKLLRYTVYASAADLC